jgi:2-dehydropantoate 2-reductase
MDMRIAVFGSGSVGGYFGARLARAGLDVAFVARGEHMRAMRDHGLRIESPLGDFTVHPVLATDDPAQVGPVDAVLVGVKAWQVAEAAEAMRPLVGADTCVVPLQNGVEAPDQLAAVLGPGPVMGGLCRVMSMVVAPGHIRHAGWEPAVFFGEMDRRPSERAERLRRAFELAGLSAQIARDIRVAMWEKFMMLAPWSGVGAVTRAPIGVIRSLPQTRAMLEEAISEVAALAPGRGIALPQDAAGMAMRFLDAVPPEGTASMQRDIQAGRPSELEAQSGAVVRLGRETGVSTPVHEFIYNCLLPMEMRARGLI